MLPADVSFRLRMHFLSSGSLLMLCAYIQRTKWVGTMCLHAYLEVRASLLRPVLRERSVSDIEGTCKREIWCCHRRIIQAHSKCVPCPPQASPGVPWCICVPYAMVARAHSLIAVSLTTRIVKVRYISRMNAYWGDPRVRYPPCVC